MSLEKRIAIWDYYRPDVMRYRAALLPEIEFPSMNQSVPKLYLTIVFFDGFEKKEVPQRDLAKRVTF
jgi:hypothetical protein